MPSTYSSSTVATTKINALSLWEYVETRYRLCEDDELTAHLCRTVFEPMRCILHKSETVHDEPPPPMKERLTKERVEEVMFAVPPAATTIRLLDDEVEEASLSAVNETPWCVTKVLDSYGLSRSSFLSIHGSSAISAKDGVLGCAALAPWQLTDYGHRERHAFVVVDVPCAEAVLRGSDVYAPGVLSSSSMFAVGETVLLIVIASSTHYPLCGSYVSSDQLSRGEGNGLPRGGVHEGERAVFGPAIIVGVGRCAMNRNDVFAPKARGTAFTNIWNPLHQPSRSVLEAVLSQRTAAVVEPPQKKQDGGCGCSAAVPPRFFLQNWSSVIPVEWLLHEPFLQRHDVTRPFRVLDACAAPGGKTSLALRMLRRYSKETHQHGGASWSFMLVAVERSRNRHKHLQSLLQDHFGSDVLSLGQVECRVGDANSLSKEIEMKGDDHTKDLRMFDAIILDPPCTGMGLRPKLLPHTFRVHHIVESADYQRKLFDSCWKLLRRGGRLSYSTCTITAEENEGNTKTILALYPDARLVAASTNEQRNVLSAMKRWSGLLNDACSAFNEYLCVRFGPLMNETRSIEETELGRDKLITSLDSVGFFVAIFEKI